MLAVARIVQPPRAAPPELAVAPPGAAPYPPALQARLAAAQAARAGEPLRTRHRRPDGTPLYTNRLILEPSPYLQQHAHNPVDWYPWGDEAFARARAEGKPVFLSVGYSTCHWCHVMEEESFEDEEIAEYLNGTTSRSRSTASERPDVDAVYMEAVQRMSGSGGWPMTVWLTADREPFYGGTYFPPRDGDRGHARRLADTARTPAPMPTTTHPDDVARRRRRRQPAGARRAGAGAGRRACPARDALRRARSTAGGAQFDARNGGFGGAPKFPRPVQLQASAALCSAAPAMPTRCAWSTRTLDAMAAGGIRDQLGGGFHRYATDARWRVPHFEKMLYDNALARRRLPGGVPGERRRRLRRRGARHPRLLEARDGGAGRRLLLPPATPTATASEGRFFVWTPDEMAAALTPPSGELLRAVYGVDAGGTSAAAACCTSPNRSARRRAALGHRARRRRGARLRRGPRSDSPRRGASAPAPLTDRKVLAGLERADDLRLRARRRRARRAEHWRAGGARRRPTCSTR